MPYKQITEYICTNLLGTSPPFPPKPPPPPFSASPPKFFHGPGPHCMNTSPPYPSLGRKGVVVVVVVVVGKSAHTSPGRSSNPPIATGVREVCDTAIPHERDTRSPGKGFDRCFTRYRCIGAVNPAPDPHDIRPSLRPPLKRSPSVESASQTPSTMPLVRTRRSEQHRHQHGHWKRRGQCKRPR